MNPILIIGKTPPPIGGVTIHVQRLLDNLERIGFQYKFIPLSLGHLIRNFFLVLMNKNIHLHSSSPLFKLFFSIFCFLTNKKLIVTNHGNLGRYGNFKDNLDLITIKLCYLPIVLNKISLEKAYKINKRSILISAFLPPIQSVKLSENIEKNILELKAKVSLLCCTNSSGFQLNSEGKDIYGILGLIEEFNKNSQFGLIVSDPSGIYKEKYNSISNPNIIFVNGDHSYYEVLKICDASIRNTSTDGDAISVKESLFLGKKTFATNIVDRPAGCITYSEFNLEVLFEKGNSFPMNSLNGFRQILEVYEKIGNEQRKM